jgi:hypothetical protein
MNWINNTIRKIEDLKNATRQNRNTVKLQVTKTPPRDVIRVESLTAIPNMHLEIKPDYEKLTMLLDMRTYSQGPTQDKFIDKLQTHFIGLGAVTFKDAYGNLYVTKGNAEFYPCVVAHTDINQEVRHNVKIMTAYPWMFGFDTEEAEQCGMGADDKVGVYFAIHMFDLFDNIKLFFPKDEEVGLIGTYKATKEFFTDCSMLVQLDRNSYKNDLITYTNGITVCSDEFVTAAGSIMDKYMYKKNNGSCTDIGGLKKYDTVNCVAMNVSCGYINEHGDNEMISIPHFENAINFGYELLKMGVDKVWQHKAEIPVYENTRYSGYGGYGTYGTGHSWGAKADKSFDLFDDLEDEKVKVNSYIANTPAGAIKLPLHCKDQDEYYNEAYPDLHSHQFRDRYLTHTIGYPSYVDNEPSVQSDIDEALTDLLCPNCWGPVEVNNSLLLYTTCDCCESTWNVPNENCPLYE